MTLHVRTPRGIVAAPAAEPWPDWRSWVRPALVVTAYVIGAIGACVF